MCVDEWNRKILGLGYHLRKEGKAKKGRKKGRKHSRGLCNRGTGRSSNVVDRRQHMKRLSIWIIILVSTTSFVAGSWNLIDCHEGGSCDEIRKGCK